MVIFGEPDNPVAVPVTSPVTSPVNVPNKLLAVTIPTFRTAVLLVSAAPVAVVVPIPTLLVV